MPAPKLSLIQNDPWLQPYEQTIVGRLLHAKDVEQKLTENCSNLTEFASGHLYFGLHHTEQGDWVFREWAPNATSIHLIGDFSHWQELQEFRLQALDHGVWEIHIPAKTIHHGQHYKLLVRWKGGQGERIPAWCRRVVQDPVTHLFSAQVWEPDERYEFRIPYFVPDRHPLLIYECHIGMSLDEEKVGTWNEFRQLILPRIAEEGYNCIQIMAIQEHPYYGSFGYHVSSFFAPSSRFGTPEELKCLVDEAHALGIAVIMDLVHSHAVRNEQEGLGLFAGDQAQYFYPGERGRHAGWDSLCFDYGKPDVLHFLLSNCKYWLEEFHFDGFRFDGVTSMLYLSHGMGQNFTSYADYYNGMEDDNAITYLMLANRLIHEIRPHAITIAEEVSGMPGLASPQSAGGYGFDYRMAMNIPDYWIKLIKEQPDENWRPSSIYWELTNRRQDEFTVSYSESHDQALVGDKTIIFRLADADMYWHFQKGSETPIVSRAVALHKMIRLITATTMNGAYLNFMGNEFGHPEWIDFPREGNGWSHRYARRQWHLADDPSLLYSCLLRFDRAMIQLLKSLPGFERTSLQQVWVNDEDQVLAYSRDSLLFVFNFSPTKSYADYCLPVAPGSYHTVLNTDHPLFGGFGLTDDEITHFSLPDTSLSERHLARLQLYLPARSAQVLSRNREM